MGIEEHKDSIKLLEHVLDTKPIDTTWMSEVEIDNYIKAHAWREIQSLTRERDELRGKLRVAREDADYKGSEILLIHDIASYRKTEFNEHWPETAQLVFGETRTISVERDAYSDRVAELEKIVEKVRELADEWKGFADLEELDDNMTAANTYRGCIRDIEPLLPRVANQENEEGTK